MRRVPDVYRLAALSSDLPGEALRHFRRALSDARERSMVLAAAGLVVVAGLFGGASQTNALSLAAVELASLPLLFLALSRMFALGAPKSSVWALGILGLLLAIPILQLIPLPESIWSQLPGREPEVQGVKAALIASPVLPLSLTPQNTFRDVLALAPPAAMFLGAIQLSGQERRALAGLWILLGLVSLALGALQMLGGADSRFYFYAVTNADSPVGLFANRNHQAAFLYSLVPLAGAFVAGARGGFQDRRGLPAVLGALFIPLAGIGVALTASRAGFILIAAALLGAFAVVLRSGAVLGRWRLATTLALPAIGGVGAVLLFAMGPIMARFGPAQAQDLRFQGLPVVLKAAHGFLPFGSGIGSFEPVYRAAEPLAQVSSTYFNHAHDDYLELWLETGVAGAVLLAAFAAWFGLRFFRIWIGKVRSGARGASGSLAAAFTVVIALLLIHSAFDYPLRTEALAVLFACGCAEICVAARGAGREERGSDPRLHIQGD